MNKNSTFFYVLDDFNLIEPKLINLSELFIMEDYLSRYIKKKKYQPSSRVIEKILNYAKTV